jgi:hypothetical protein
LKSTLNIVTISVAQAYWADMQRNTHYCPAELDIDKARPPVASVPHNHLLWTHERRNVT